MVTQVHGDYADHEIRDMPLTCASGREAYPDLVATPRRTFRLQSLEFADGHGEMYHAAVCTQVLLPGGQSVLR